MSSLGIMIVPSHVLKESVLALQQGHRVIDVFDDAEGVVPTGEYAFLSNFYIAPFEYPVCGDPPAMWPTVEHAYQASKSRDKGFHSTVRALVGPNGEPAPGLAKRLGRQVHIRPDWEQVKVKIMYGLLLSKFLHHPDLRSKLLATGDAILIEGNLWHDDTWGSCACKQHIGIPGENYLGKMLMRIRDSK